MPHLRSRAKAGPPSSAAAPPSPPAAAGVPSGTPAPSPTTSLGLRLGPASPDDVAGSLKSPAAAPPRRSLRLAGASPATPTAEPSAQDGGSSGSGTGSGRSSNRRGRGRGSGRGRGRARVSASPGASPMAGDSGSDGGGSGNKVLAGGGSGGVGAFMSLRSGSRVAKRQVETGAQVDGETGAGLGGGIGDGGQVHDEMLQQDAGARAKRCKRVLVGGVETDYVADSESDSDEDCVIQGKVCTRLQLSIGLSVVEPLVVPDSESDSDADAGVGRDDPAGTGKEEIGDGDSLKHDFLNGEVGHTYNFLGTEVGVAIEQAASPVGSPSSPEMGMQADMYFKEELRRYDSRNRGKGKGKLVLEDNDSGAGASVGTQDGTRTQKYSPDSKGKGKMVVEDSLSSLSSSEDEMDFDAVDSKEIQNNSVSVSASVEPIRRQAARERAIRLAPKFAFFKADKDEHSEDDEEEELEPAADPQDWPGPFSTAAKIYEDRDAKLRARESSSSKLKKSADKAILWTPSNDRKSQLRSAPSLTDLCLSTLADHAEGIESLGGIPEELKHKLLKMLCRSRKMNTHLLNELWCDSPTELQLSECSWLSEDDFEKTFGKCRTENLQVLQLDISGRCLPDYILRTTLAKVPNCMPLLTKISLKGNYRLSDNGLETIVSAAPSLNVLNLSECSLLTSSGIEILAEKLHSVLRELYIDDCINVDAMMILPALQKIQHLEVLSMSGIQSVCDKFVNELIPVHGSNIRELAFAGCLKLTSSSIKTIGQNCPRLSSLDLRNLNRLRDSAMRHLRNGCRQIKKLKLQRNSFSDEALSQYLEESGGCLTELMLNNVEKAGDLTALAIASKCSVRLEVLDLSFCRELTNEALGLVVDSCSSLRFLKLFGCTQISDIFLKGHSNRSVKIVGLEGNILEQMDSHYLGLRSHDIKVLKRRDFTSQSTLQESAPMVYSRDTNGRVIEGPV
ncbi:hypothetical protein EJB05_48796 [Eragrostis curvula]|uniref:Uncharacterized protein n=1 Tax=Eragrostis curvula TaxID=38414 RepID=A0A5J9T334_9POAL|nr:hypothetical protein EJB05_48796 [Eragrostis curvula]